MARSNRSNRRELSNTIEFGSIGSGIISINGVLFEPNKDILAEGLYRYDYYALFFEAMHELEDDPEAVNKVVRSLVKDDLFFVTYFILKNPLVNSKPWAVKTCYEIQDNKHPRQVLIWARGHLKSTFLTVGKSIQRTLCEPLEYRKEPTIGIFSFNQVTAERFLESIRQIFETSVMLKLAFPKRLYQNPTKEAHSWNQKQLILKRQYSNKKEADIAAFGLIDAMPTSVHLDHLIFDDVSTDSLAITPEIRQKVCDRFDMACTNLVSDDSTVSVAGTIYHRADLIARLYKEYFEEGKRVFDVSLKTASHNGKVNGKPVFLSQSMYDFKKSVNLRIFYTQSLCNPTPPDVVELKEEQLIPVSKKDLPKLKDMYTFFSIDPAGEANKQGDNWALTVVGVHKVKKSVTGISPWYLLDCKYYRPEQEDFVEQVIEDIVQIYLRNSPIDMLGVESNGLSLIKYHVRNKLIARGIPLKESKKVGKVTTKGNIMKLVPQGRSKEKRIRDVLPWQLNTGNLHYLETISPTYIEILRREMREFPHGSTDDAIDSLAYIGDMATGFKFRNLEDDESYLREDRYRFSNRRKVKVLKTGVSWLSA